MTTELNKVVRVGTTTEGSVFCKIKFADNRLSITGVIGPQANGNCRGSCGQIDMGLTAADITKFAPGWDADMLADFLDLWGKWHLNDLTAGSPEQQAFLSANPVKYQYPQTHYGEALKALDAAGLQPDPNYLGEDGNPYRYGSAWLHTDVPQSAIDSLAALPDTDEEPAWV